jgi:ABC-type Zn uptake system ZnuABC Zn-binding protein ZnuA
MRKFFFALGICLVAGCSKQAAEAVPAASRPAPAKKLLVMATIAPMYCFAKNVAGDLAEVELIMPPGADARNFNPSEDEVRRIMQADLVVENGFGFEGWMDELEARGLRAGEERMLAARGTGPGIPGLSGDPDSAPGDAPADPSQPPDPHVWLDPVMAIKEVQNIRDALMKLDPAHADGYLANENAYESSLRDLDDEAGRFTVDITKRRLLCAGETFSYFLSRYEFTAAKSAAEADAVLVARGVETKSLNGNGLPVVIADPMETGPASTDFYERTTRANVEALREGLLR